MKSSTPCIRLVTCLLAVILTGTAAMGQHALAAEGIPLQQAPPSGAEGSKYFYQRAGEYEIRMNEDKVPLQLVASPLLNWTNPARTNEQGILVVWLKQGRPEALATLFTYQISDRVYEKHELLSLSRQPLVATFGGRRAWAPATGGIQEIALEELAPPAKQPRVRALQMRQIAREFTGGITNRAGETTTLRALPQPLYRYQDTQGELIDGALFSLNVGTDPEVLIIVEAYQGASGATWKCALARLHYNELNVQRQGKPLWKAQPAYELMNDLTGKGQYLSQPYFTYYPETLLRSAKPAP